MPHTRNAALQREAGLSKVTKVHHGKQRFHSFVAVVRSQMQRGAIVIQVEKRIRKPVQSAPNFTKVISESFEDIAQIAAPRGRVGSDELVVGATDLFVERQVGRAAQTAALGVLVENPAEKERVIADMGAEQERLLGGGSRQRDQHIGYVLLSALGGHVRRPQTARARKRLEQ